LGKQVKPINKTMVKKVIKSEVNLYNVSCGIHQYFKVAKNEDEAIKEVGETNHLQHLPFNALKIDLEGFILVKE